MIWMMITAFFVIASPWLTHWLLGKNTDFKGLKSDLDLTILVPFRNEENNLPQLINALKHLSNSVPVIFINDHSEDDSELIIQSALAENHHWKLLTLEDTKTGKKMAIQLGLKMAKSAFVLTLDADVRFNSDLLRHANISADLVIRPVRMVGSRFCSKIFAMEYNLFNAINFLVFYKRPISASGANLIVNRKLYLAQLEEDQHSLNYSSGDDYFLLHYALRKKKLICLDGYSSSFVNTPAPETFKAYLHQRTRWISKTFATMRLSDFFAGLWSAVYVGTPLAILCLLMAYENLWYFIVLISLLIVRVFSDVWLLWRYSTQTNLFIAVVFPFIHPILFLWVTIASWFMQPKWKGRAMLKT